MGDWKCPYTLIASLLACFYIIVNNIRYSVVDGNSMVNDSIPVVFSFNIVSVSLSFYASFSNRRKKRNDTLGFNLLDNWVGTDLCIS